MERRQNTETVVALAVLSLLWGYNWVAIKLAMIDSGPIRFAALRTTIAVTALFLAMLALRRSLKPTPFVPTLILGLLQTTLFMLMQVSAVAIGGAGKTAVLTYTMPFWAILLAWPLLGERVRGLQWLAVALSALGLGLRARSDRRARGFATEILATVGAIFWALGAIWMKRVRARYDVDLIALTTWQMFWGVLPMIALALLVPERPIDVTLTFLAALGFVALSGTAFAWLLWMFALSRLQAGTAGLASLRRRSSACWERGCNWASGRAARSGRASR